MSAPRRLKHIDEELDRQLDQDELHAVGGTEYNIIAQRPDRTVPVCPECGQPMKNHGLFSKQYLDYTSGEDEPTRYITLTYKFYKYICVNPECSCVYQEPKDFADKNRHITKRLEERIVQRAMFYSYDKTSGKVGATVSKQAVGQILNAWITAKDALREQFVTPTCLGLISFEWERKNYILVVDAANTSIPIIDVIPEISSSAIQMVLNNLDKTAIQTVVVCFNQIVIDTVTGELPDAEIMITTDDLLEMVKHLFESFFRSDAKQVGTHLKRSILGDPNKVSDYLQQDVRSLFAQHPTLDEAYQLRNRLMYILSPDFGPEELWEWHDMITGRQMDIYGIPYQYIESYWRNILVYYRRRHEITPELYNKLEKLDKKLKERRPLSKNALRARILYSGRTEGPGAWEGIPLDSVMENIDNLLNQIEEEDNV